MSADLDDQEDQRGQGFPQLLHDRARNSAVELHKLLLSLAVGAVGLFFLALTGKVEPPLSMAQKVVVLLAVISMAVAALSGIICWFADCRRNYFWASALQANDKEKRSELYRQRDQWLKREKVAAKCLIAMFVVGIVVSACYMALRVVGE